MRIGLVAPPWIPVPPPRYGGTEAVVDRLARGLQDVGHEVLLWTTGDATCPVPKGWVFEHGQIDRLGFDAIELHHLVRGYEAMVAWGPDLVHDHTLIGPVYARRHPELAVVTTNHGPFDDALTALYRDVADDVPVIAISHDQASRAHGLAVAAVIHHGVDVDAVEVGDGAGGHLLYLGRMCPEKGVVEAIRAAHRAGVPLVIGAKMRDRDEAAYFESEVRPLLGGDTTFVGEVGGAEKQRLLRDAVALLNPIRWPEPFGLVMIEALACGTPVVAYPEGAAPEIVDHGITGFLCRDEDDLVRRIADVQVLDRTDCRRAAEARFSTARMVADHVELYERVVAARARRAVGA